MTREIVILAVFALCILGIIAAARVLQGLLRVVVIMAVITVALGVGLWTLL